VSFDTSNLPDGAYDLRARAFDGFGNSSSDVRASILIDNGKPQLVSSAPADGDTVGSAGAIDLVASEPIAALANPTLDGAPAPVPTIAGTHLAFATGALAAGPHALAGELEDMTGKRTPIQVHFTVWNGSTAAVPYVEKNMNLTSATTVDSADGSLSVTMPAHAWFDTGNGDWLVLCVDPQPAPAASSLPSGWQAAGGEADVRAAWAIAGTQQHWFDEPLDILLRTSDSGLVPATSQSSGWRVLEQVPSGQTLPTSWDDGYYRNADGVHVLTRHLSSFALLRRVSLPAPLTLSVSGPSQLSWAKRSPLALKVSVSRAATTRIKIVNGSGKTVLSWTGSLTAGSHSEALKTLTAFSKAGTYTVRVTASTSDSTRSASIKVKVLAKSTTSAHNSASSAAGTGGSADGGDPGAGDPSGGTTPQDPAPTPASHAPAAGPRSPAPESASGVPPVAKAAPGSQSVTPIVTTASEHSDLRRLVGLALLGLFLVGGLATALRDALLVLLAPYRHRR
jgi:hypothetical protein